jgi:hypothetical protein
MEAGLPAKYYFVFFDNSISWEEGEKHAGS